MHVHVFGPYDRFPLAEDRSYTPVEAPVEAFVAHLDALGFERGVIVTASAQGTDNGAMLDALRRYPTRFRGVAVLPPETTDRTLDEMTAAGVRGLRLNLLRSAAGERTYRNGVGYDSLKALGPRIKERGWHLQIWIHARDLAEALPLLEPYGMELVVDHMGRISTAGGHAGAPRLPPVVRPAARRPGLDQDLGCRPHHRRRGAVAGGRPLCPRIAGGECRALRLGHRLAAYRLFRPADVGGCGAGRDAGALDPGCRDAQGACSSTMPPSSTISEGETVPC